MNKKRKKKLCELKTQIIDVKYDVEELVCDEEEAFDNLPENLQESERGEDMQEWIEKLNDLNYTLDEVESVFNEMELD